MRRTLIIISLLLLTPAAQGQWLERIIYLPDSFPGVEEATVVLHNPVTNRMYLSGEDARGLHVLDAATRQKYAWYGAMEADEIIHCPDLHRLYAYSPGWESFMSFDDRADTLLFSRPAEEPLDLLYNPSLGKLYLLHEPGRLEVLDAGPDTVLTTIELPSTAFKLAWDSVHNRIYSMNRRHTSAELVIDIIDCSSDSVVGWLPGPELWAQDIVCYPELSQLFCAGSDSLYRSQLWVYDTDSLVAHHIIPMPVDYASGWPVRLFLNPLSGYLYAGVSGGSDGHDTLTVIDCRTLTVARQIELPEFAAPNKYALNRIDNKVYLIVRGHDVAVFGVPDSITGWLGEESRVYGIGWNGTDNELYLTCREDTVSVYDAEADTLVDEMSFSPIDAERISWNSGGNLYAFEDRGVAKVSPEGRVVSWVPRRMDFVTRPQYSAELNRFYVCGEHDDLLVYDCNADAFIDSTPLPVRQCNAGLLVPELHRVLVSSLRDTTVAYDIYADTVAAWTCGIGNRYAYNRGNRLAYGRYQASASGHEVVVFDPVTFERIHELSWLQVTDLQVVARHNTVWLVDRDSSVYVLDGNSHEVVDTLRLGCRLHGLSVVEELDRVYVHGEGEEGVFDAETRQLLRIVPTNVSSYQSLYNPRNRKFYLSGRAVGSIRDTMVVVDCRRGSVVAGFAVRQFSDMAWDPVRNRVYGSQSNRLYVFRDELTGTSEERSPIAHQPLGATLVRGNLLLTAREAAELLDITGRRAQTLKPGSNDLRGLAPGVYFLRPADSGERPAVSKVVVQK